MSDSKKALAAMANKLRRQIAECEAKADGYKTKLAQIEARLDGRAVPLSGLDQLWKMTPEVARNRCSKHLCRVAWNKIPPAERPPIQTMLDAMARWVRCDEWKKDGGAYIPNLERWIKERRWEDPPEVKDAPSRYRNVPKPVPVSNPDEEITDPAEIAKFLSIKPPRMNS